MRTKVITNDCSDCDLMKVDDENHLTCNWTNGGGKRVKYLVPQKGKKSLKCKLKK